VKRTSAVQVGRAWLFSHAALLSRGTQCVESVDVPCATAQEIFATRVLMAAKQELSKSHHAFEDAEDGLRRVG
jgi:hypothetical protein